MGLLVTLVIVLVTYAICLRLMNKRMYVAPSK